MAFPAPSLASPWWPKTVVAARCPLGREEQAGEGAGMRRGRWRVGLISRLKVPGGSYTEDASISGSLGWSLRL